jgi:hypothetical protein
MLPFEFFRLHGSVPYLGERSGARLVLLDLCLSDQLLVIRGKRRGCEYDATDDRESCAAHMLHLHEGPNGPLHVRRVRTAVIQNACAVEPIAVLARIDWLHEDVEADAELVAYLLGIAEAARLLDELEAAGDIASATGPLQ